VHPQRRHREVAVRAQPLERLDRLGRELPAAERPALGARVVDRAQERGLAQALDALVSTAQTAC